MATCGDTCNTTVYSSINGDLIFNDLKGMAAGDNDACRNITDLFLMLNAKIAAQQIKMENLVLANDTTQARIKNGGMWNELSHHWKWDS